MSHCRQCNNHRCVANVEGKCAVQNCSGPITALDVKKATDVEKAAAFYHACKRAFEVYFPKKDNS